MHLTFSEGFAIVGFSLGFFAKIVFFPQELSFSKRKGLVQGEGFEPSNLREDQTLNLAPLTRLGDPCLEAIYCGKGLKRLLCGPDEN
jgi:hypothetical protein